MTRVLDDRFADWKEKALAADILTEAIRLGAKLTGRGAWRSGPCPHCGGVDRFSVQIRQGRFNCRGAGGGDVVAMVRHIKSLSFLEACELLTGESCPSGPGKPLSEAERAERNRVRLKNEEAQRQRDRQEMEYQADTKEAAQAIWNASKPIDKTLAQTYLYGRGIPPFETAGLRFHPALPYPGKPKPYPTLICRVDDVEGRLCSVWRIYLRGDGRKADVEQSKLGLGPAGGGAVRIGGLGPKIGLAEGLESALGAWNLIGRKYPVWAALSTSGLVGIELPLGVEHVVLFPDGDHSMRKKDGEFVPSVPAGRKAALTLRARLLAEGIACTIAAEPSAGKDYADIWAEHSREVA